MQQPHMRNHGQRAGFTLIELLVVMSIMAILMALTTGAITRVIHNNRISTTEEIVRRLSVLSEQAVRQVIDSAREETIPQTFYPANGDPDVALQQYTNARLAQEFPMSFAEALAPGSLTADTTYAAKLASATGGGTDNENSMCLHMMLTAKNRRGDMSDSQFVAEYTKADASGLTVIYDAWDNPITFVRGSYKDRPVIVIISAGPNRQKSPLATVISWDAGGNVVRSTNPIDFDNIYSVDVGR